MNAIRPMQQQQDTRPPLGSLAAKMERRPPETPLAPSRHAAHALVVVDGPADLEAALKRLRRAREYSGLHKLMKRDSRVFEYQRPGVRRRVEQVAARARVAKLAKQVALRDHEAPGTRRGVPRREGVVAAPAA